MPVSLAKLQQEAVSNSVVALDTKVYANGEKLERVKVLSTWEETFVFTTTTPRQSVGI